MSNFLGVSEDATGRDLVPLGLWLVAMTLVAPVGLASMWVLNQHQLYFLLLFPFPIVALLGGFIVKPKLGIFPLFLMAPFGTGAILFSLALPALLFPDPQADLWPFALFIFAFPTFLVVTVCLIVGRLARRVVLHR